MRSVRAFSCGTATTARAALLHSKLLQSHREDAVRHGTFKHNQNQLPPRHRQNSIQNMVWSLSQNRPHLHPTRHHTSSQITDDQTTYHSSHVPLHVYMYGIDTQHVRVYNLNARASNSPHHQVRAVLENNILGRTHHNSSICHQSTQEQATTQYYQHDTTTQNANTSQKIPGQHRLRQIPQR